MRLFLPTYPSFPFSLHRCQISLLSEAFLCLLQVALFAHVTPISCNYNSVLASTSLSDKPTKNTHWGLCKKVELTYINLPQK